MTAWLDHESVETVFVTLKLAGLTTILLLILATPIAWWLARTKSAWRVPIASMVALPLVLPPTVSGSIFS